MKHTLETNQGLNCVDPGKNNSGVGLALGVVGLAVVVWLCAGLAMARLQMRLTPNDELQAEKELAALASMPRLPMLDFDLHDWGRQQYAKSCVACHGTNGRGLPKLGKDLVHSEFVKTQSDEDLVRFVLKGRTPSDPANTTKVDMPPKGGNPVLDEEDIACIVQYLRGLQDPRRVPTAPKAEAGEKEGVGHGSAVGSE